MKDNSTPLYRVSIGYAGSAFQLLGEFTLDGFPSWLSGIADYLRENKDTEDISLTSADRNVIIRKEGTELY